MRKTGYKLAMMFVLSAGCLAMSGCIKDILNFFADDITGRWVVEGTQEYWRFRIDGTGVTWDESEDISESESNLRFEWTLDEDELTCVFRGENENQAVPKVYYIRKLTSERMEWEDIYGRTVKLVKR